MRDYARNIGLWLRGFRWLWSRRWVEPEVKQMPSGVRFAMSALKPDPGYHIVYDEGWGPWRFLPVYLLDVGFCCLVAAGAVEPLSGFMHRHRQGWFNDKVLDTIEVADPEHGARAGRPLWGSVESSLTVRIIVPALWLAAVLLLAG